MSIHSVTIADENQGAVFAQAPFDHVDAADIIVRSSDGMYFRMIKLLLSLASPIFKDLFSLPRSTEGIDEAKDGLPIVDLAEKSGTIKNLLSFCYPAIYNGNVGLVETLSEVSALLEVVQKYEMEGIRKAVVRSLIQPRFLEQEPLRVYAIACRHKLETEARLAAKHTLHRPSMEDAYFEELASIDAGQLYRAQLYRKECAKAAMKVASDHTWIKADGYYLFFKCNDKTESQTHTFISSLPSRKYQGTPQLVHTWWKEYMASTQVALQSSSRGETVKDLGRVGRAFAGAGGCPSCRTVVVDDFRRFVDRFAKEIDLRISEVCLDLEFK